MAEIGGVRPAAGQAAGHEGEPGAVLIRQVEDAHTQWSAGAFGVIAEFSRDEQEKAKLTRSSGAIAVSTQLGAVSLVTGHREARLVAYETVSRDAETWRHSVALCLPQAANATPRRRVLTEIGRDENAVREEDRVGNLFDLGLDLEQTVACVRTSEPGLIAALRAGEGKPLFEAHNPALMEILKTGPHRVFITPLARIEVFQPIPPPHGKSPHGPHTHILPKLLQARRTHAATVPIPPGWIPCANFYPPHALFDGQGRRRNFDARHLASFNALLRQYGDPELVALQEAVMSAVRSGAAAQDFPLPRSKHARAALRVALRKMRASGFASPDLDRWRAHFDRPNAEGAEDEADEEAQHAS